MKKIVELHSTFSAPRHSSNCGRLCARHKEKRSLSRTISRRSKAEVNFALLVRLNEIVLIVCCIVGFSSSSFGQKPFDFGPKATTKYRSLECIDIVDRRFESCLDSMLMKDRSQHYFSEDLTYGLWVLHVPTEDNSEAWLFRMMAIGRTHFFDDYKAVLQYKGHDFIILLDDWDSLNPRILARTGRKIKVPFWEGNLWYTDERGNIGYIVTLDDTMPYRYAYKNDVFKEIPY